MCGFKRAIAPLEIRRLAIGSGFHRIGHSVALRLIEGPQLAAQDSYVRGRFETECDAVAGHAANDHGNPISNNDLLSYLAAKNQHDPGPP
jgi:hypothetical protein